MAWIQHPLTLKGRHVRLEPLTETHFNALAELALTPEIWTHYIYTITAREHLLPHLTQALAFREQGAQYPFTIIDQASNTIIGSTRYLDLHAEHQKLEIGWTWLHPDYWGTAANTECKLLLLTHAFETLHARRVMLRTDERNLRSRKAIEKTGAKFEGILRNDLVRENGTSRHSAYYSILDSEWGEIKRGLVERVGVAG